MHDFLKSDIFFIVTTVAVIIFSIGFVIIMVYAIRILRDIKSLSTKVKDQGEGIMNDLYSLRKSVSLFGLFKKRRSSKIPEDEV